MVHGLATLTLSGAYGDADPEALALQCAHQLFRGPDPGVVLAPPG